MSHTSKYKQKIKNFDVLKSVLKSKNIKFKENCSVKMFGINKIDSVVAFKLDGWRYECAVTKDGEIMYDHFGSRPNTFDQLGELVQTYNKEAIMSEALGMATNWWEEKTKNNEIKLIFEYQ